MPPVSTPRSSNLSKSPIAGSANESPRGSPPGVRPSVLGSVDLGVRLLRYLVTENLDRNLLISPFALSLGLATLATAARGECFESIAGVLGVKADGPVSLRDEYARMKGLLDDVASEVQLRLGCSVWLNNKFALDAKWAEESRNGLDTEISRVSFEKGETSALIDKWVRERTAGRIQGLVERTDPAMIMILISLVYFYGSWHVPFDLNETRQLPFYSPSGSQQHPMMSQSGSFSYFENQSVQAISLPYGRHQWMDFCIFLPRLDRSLSNVLGDLSPETWWNWMTDWDDRDGTITLPRFRFSCSLELTEPLKALGMVVPFDRQRADFSGALQAATSVFLDRIRQKSFIEVNEKGTEAAAAYSFVELSASQLEPPPPFRIVVDRPFLFVVRDRRTDCPLFVGSVADPSRQES